MKTFKELLVDFGKQKGQYSFELHFRFPNIFLRITSEHFANKDRDERLQWLAQTLAISEQELADTCFHANVFLQLETSSEKEDDPDVVPEQGESWLREQLVDIPHGYGGKKRELPEQVRTLHFFGYKGGQGRSTGLACLARALAHDGYRVLVLDIDQEAPSLHILLGIQQLGLENTLLGISMDQKVTPVAITGEFRQRGAVELIGCYPTDERYALESVALALRSGLDALWSEGCALKLDTIRKEGNYDVLLVDHRSGLSAFSQPWLHSLPGPVVFFSRLDHQWKTAVPFVPSLFRVYPPVPGVIVSFADQVDPEMESESAQLQISELLQLMDKGVRSGDSPSRRMYYAGNAESLRNRFVIWPYDSRLAMKSHAGENTWRLSQDIKDALHSIRSLLELSASKLVSLHGAEDRRPTLLLAAMQEVLKEHSPIRYIFGRKGTGKTRLCASLADSQELGYEPLLVDPGPAEINVEEESGSSRVRTHGLSVKEAHWATILKPFDDRDDREAFFWMLFAAGLKAGKENREALWDCLKEMAGRINSTALARQELDQVLKKREDELGRPEERRTFLLDGLEVLLAKQTKEQRADYMASLFRVLANIRSDLLLLARLDYRLFLRSDLVPQGHQNLEQQLEWQMVRLRWRIEDILRFMLSCMSTLTFVQDDFPKVRQELDSRKTDIRDGRIELSEAERLLALVFPSHLPWKGAQVPLFSFWREFFSDSPKVGANAEDKTYHPRVVDVFLRTINNTPQVERIRGDRLNPEVVLAAYRAAAEIFRESIAQEIRVLLPEETKHQAFFAELVGCGGTLDRTVLPKSEQHVSRIDFGKALDLLEAMGVFSRKPDSGTDKLQAGELVQAALQLTAE